MLETRPYQVLLYYQYVRIEDPEAFAAEHLRYCKENRLLGRIIVAPEGINGTVSGRREATKRYIEHMHADPRFGQMAFKIDDVDQHVFSKIFVRAKAELVTLRLDRELDPLKRTGKYLEPSEFYRAMTEEDVVVIDGRSDYEYDIGHFEGAIRPDARTFRDFPQWVREELAQYKDKKVLTYCTGGIRCEKFSALLLEEGFKDVSQLKGGIVSYGKDPETRGKLFKGKCYVFDERIAVPVTAPEYYQPAGICRHCGTQCDRIVNCANLDCDEQQVTCEPCEAKMRRACSAACVDAPRNTYPFHSKSEWLAAKAAHSI